MFSWLFTALVSWFFVSASPVILFPLWLCAPYFSNSLFKLCNIGSLSSWSYITIANHVLILYTYFLCEALVAPLTALVVYSPWKGAMSSCAKWGFPFTYQNNSIYPWTAINSYLPETISAIYSPIHAILLGNNMNNQICYTYLEEGFLWDTSTCVRKEIVLRAMHILGAIFLCQLLVSSILASSHITANFWLIKTLTIYPLLVMSTIFTPSEALHILSVLAAPIILSFIIIFALLTLDAGSHITLMASKLKTHSPSIESDTEQVSTDFNYDVVQSIDETRSNLSPSKETELQNSLANQTSKLIPETINSIPNASSVFVVIINKLQNYVIFALTIFFWLNSIYTIWWLLTKSTSVHWLVILVVTTTLLYSAFISICHSLKYSKVPNLLPGAISAYITTYLASLDGTVSISISSGGTELSHFTEPRPWNFLAIIVILTISIHHFLFRGHIGNTVVYGADLYEELQEYNNEPSENDTEDFTHEVAFASESLTNNKINTNSYEENSIPVFDFNSSINHYNSKYIPTSSSCYNIESCQSGKSIFTVLRKDCIRIAKRHISVSNLDTVLNGSSTCKSIKNIYSKNTKNKFINTNRSKNKKVLPKQNFKLHESSILSNSTHGIYSDYLDIISNNNFIKMSQNNYGKPMYYDSAFKRYYCTSNKKKKLIYKGSKVYLYENNKVNDFTNFYNFNLVQKYNDMFNMRTKEKCKISDIEINKNNLRRDDNVKISDIDILFDADKIYSKSSNSCRSNKYSNNFGKNDTITKYNKLNSKVTKREFHNSELIKSKQILLAGNSPHLQSKLRRGKKAQQRFSFSSESRCTSSSSVPPFIDTTANNSTALITTGQLLKRLIITISPPIFHIISRLKFAFFSTKHTADPWFDSKESQYYRLVLFCTSVEYVSWLNFMLFSMSHTFALLALGTNIPGCLMALVYSFVSVWLYCVNEYSSGVTKTNKTRFFKGGENIDQLSLSKTGNIYHSPVKEIYFDVNEKNANESNIIESINKFENRSSENDHILYSQNEEGTISAAEHILYSDDLNDGEAISSIIHDNSNTKRMAYNMIDKTFNEFVNETSKRQAITVFDSIDIDKKNKRISKKESLEFEDVKGYINNSQYELKELASSQTGEISESDNISRSDKNSDINTNRSSLNQTNSIIKKENIERIKSNNTKKTEIYSESVLLKNRNSKILGASNVSNLEVLCSNFDTDYLSPVLEKLVNKTDETSLNKESNESSYRSAEEENSLSSLNLNNTMDNSLKASKKLNNASIHLFPKYNINQTHLVNTVLTKNKWNSSKIEETGIQEPTQTDSSSEDNWITYEK